MKKVLILFAAVVLMAMTACNEKPANKAAEGEQPATEQATDTAQTKQKPIVDVEKAKPTEDGKDHIVGDFNTKDYQVRLENLADGTYRLSLWKRGQNKSEKPDQIAETKKCVMKEGSYLMQTDDGKNYIVGTKAGSESLIIMDDKGISYSEKGVK